MIKLKLMICAVMLGSLVPVTSANEVILTASKDTFSRSNARNTNSGGNEYLAVASSPMIRSIIGFDLSSITNEITSAELQFRQHNSVEAPLTLVVAPMLHTANNATWIEGIGALGVKGRNALHGEATFAWRAFRDMPWESVAGDSNMGLMDDNLWLTPIAKRGGLQWIENTWISIPVTTVANLEKVRKSEAKIITYGLWGTVGNGTYLISSKESGHAPKLVLTLKETREAGK